MKRDMEHDMAAKNNAVSAAAPANTVPTVPSLEIEGDLAASGAGIVVGFDEVGRGALAGPVMVGAAAVRAVDLLDSTQPLDVPKGLADSKLLTEHRREALFEPLQSWCAAWAVGQASNSEIDEWGITHALGIAALRALVQVERTLGLTSDEPIRLAAILDGPNDFISKAINTFDAPDLPLAPEVTTLVKADRQCASVAAAAVLAKVTRDRLMVDLARSNPAYAPYGWEHNKGYGSADHRAAIAAHGPSPLHRISWKLT